jgi:hypothetical protein
VLADLSASRARDLADQVDDAGGTDRGRLTSAVLRLHADRVDRCNREQRLLSRFTNAHPGVPVASVPAVAGDITDLAGLREIGSRLTSRRRDPAAVVTDSQNALG